MSLDNVKVIDCTPKWADVLPIYIAVLEDGGEAGRVAARAELARMAEAADKYNELCKAKQNGLES